MPDVLTSTSRDLEKRLAELRPVVAEYERLQAAERALAGIGSGTAARRAGRGRSNSAKARAAKPTAPTTRRKAGARRGGGRPKGSGGRAAQALELVKGQPGITIPELAQAMGIKQNYLYRVLPGLEKERKVTKRGKGWYPRG